jgi:microcystin-dependent protein
VPSTYSQSLKLELIATGEQSGTWGNTADTNFTLIDQAVAGWGYPVFNVDADLNVFISDALPSAGRCAVLWVTSTAILTAPRNLVVSGVSKSYIVHNATTGGQPITVKTATGAGVTISNGNRRSLIGDGTNFVDAVTEVAAISSAGQFLLPGYLAPAALASNQNDYAPVGMDAASVLQLQFTSGSYGLTGLAGGVTGRIVVIENTGSFPLTLFSENAGSAAANRFALGVDVLLQPLAGITFHYVGRWRAIGAYGQDALPVGTVLDYGGDVLPERCVWAAGQYLDQTVYARLYAKYGAKYGASAGTFAVPDLRGRVIAGRDDMGGAAANRLTALGGLGGAGGEQSHVISGNELPYHKHGIYDPGHAHSISDGGHNHGVGDPTHAHGLADPGHAHGIGDPSHSHDIPQSNVGGPGGYTILGGGAGAHRTFASGTGVYTGAVGTGQGVYGAYTGLYLGASGTGIGIYGSGTGVDTYNAGANWGMSLLQPTMILNKIIYAGA